MRHPRYLVLLLVLIGACGRDPASPSTGPAGVYRLVSVEGQPLPYKGPPCICAFRNDIARADLLLRDDGTFGLGLEGTFGSFSSGTYRVAENALVLTAPTGDPADPLLRRDGVLAGDSIVLRDAALNVRYVYRRAPPPTVPIAAAVYRLRLVNGRAEPFTAYDTVVNGTRFVRHIVFDTLAFDGFFYRRHRFERDVAYPARGDSLTTQEEWTTWGSYEGGAGATAILRPYWPSSLELGQDSLTLLGGELIRHGRLSVFFSVKPFEERYGRAQ